MDFGVFLLFDDENSVQNSIHTDIIDTVIEELGCENLKLIGRVGEDGVPVYAFTGEDDFSFVSATGHNFADFDTFLEETGISPEEYSAAVEEAASDFASHKEGLLDFNCGPGVLAELTMPPKSMG